jgi:hypothetical protein
MSDKFILSVGAGDNQVPLLEAIRRLGYSVASCDINPDAPGKKLSDIFLNVSTHDPDAIISLLQQKSVRPDAVLTRSTGYPVVTCAVIAEYFDLPGIDVANSKILIHKNKLLNELNSLKIASAKLYNDDDKIILPVFVKPANTALSHAAMGVCHTREQLDKKIAEAKQVSSDGIVNIEEYLLGSDIVSIDFVFDSEIIHLLSIGEISTGTPAFDGLGWYTLNGVQDECAKNNFATIRKGLAIKHGFFQTAMKYDHVHKKAKTYEIHAEIGGDLVNDVFIPTITDGYDVFHNNLRLSLGYKPATLHHLVIPSVIFFKSKIEQYNIDVESELIIDSLDLQYAVLLRFAHQGDVEQYLSELSAKGSVSYRTDGV